MRRLLVHVEGQTEYDFVNDLLRPHLTAFGYASIYPSLMGNARRTNRGGGVRSWTSARREIVDHLHEDRARLVTTMVDFYAMPTSWPGRSKVTGRSSEQKAQQVEHAMHADIAKHRRTHSGAGRFRPFVMMHEFEALLFSDPACFAATSRQPGIEPALRAILTKYASPEDINEKPETIPSRRIIELIPNYQKRTDGPKAAAAIGLLTIRAACPHFNAWLTDLETWPTRLAQS